jgi:hypothetical protein
MSIYRSAADASGFVTASVVDPFGNVLGLMYSPHYVEKNLKPRPT